MKLRYHSKLLLVVVTLFVGCSEINSNDIKLINTINIGRANNPNQLIWNNNGKLVVPTRSNFVILDNNVDNNWKTLKIEKLEPFFENIYNDFGVAVPTLYAFSKEHSVLNFFYEREIIRWDLKKDTETIVDDESLPVAQDYFDLYSNDRLWVRDDGKMLTVESIDGTEKFNTNDYISNINCFENTTAYRVQMAGNMLFIVSNIEDLYIGKDIFTFVIQIFRIEGKSLIKEKSFTKKYKPKDLHGVLRVNINQETPFPFDLGDAMDFVIDLGNDKYLIPFNPDRNDWSWSIYENGMFTVTEMERMNPTRNPFTWAISPDRKMVAYYDRSGDNLLVYKVKE